VSTLPFLAVETYPIHRRLIEAKENMIVVGGGKLTSIG
jgi:hypothetical protein